MNPIRRGLHSRVCVADTSHVPWHEKHGWAREESAMRRQTLLRRLLIATGAVVVLLIVALGPSVIAHFTKQPKQPALATVEQESFPVLATAAGQLVPANLENVNFTIAGQVQTIAVQVGAKVNAGQSLATLNDSSQQSVL